MASSSFTGGFGFSLEWMGEGSSIGEVCAETAVSSPALPKLESDDSVEIQVMEEEVVTDWGHPNGGIGSSLLDATDPLADQEDEYSRLHPFPCDFCSQRFSKKSSLNVHMMSHQIPKHSCSCCPLTFSDESDLIEHLKSHAYSLNGSDRVKMKGKLKKERKSDVEAFPVLDPARPYVCQYCGVGFAREKALASHKLIHAGDTAVECKKCNDVFENDSHLEDHVNREHGPSGQSRKIRRDRPKSHDPLGPIRVPSPNYFPVIDRSQITHTERTENELAMCRYCHIVFADNDDLICHKEEHDHDLDMHSCSICSETVESLPVLCNHIIESHTTSHACTHCDRIFKDETTLSKHLLTHSHYSLKCPNCPKILQNKQSMKKHISTHVEKPAIACVDCGDTDFTDGTSLLYHRQMTHGVNLARLFPCFECGKTFNSRSSQQIHIRIHTGERPYGCRFCWKAFGDGGTLRKHERIHTGEKPYVCPVCSKAFNQRVVLREHIRAHHGAGDMARRNFGCYVCPETFSNSNELIVHLVQHADENTAKHRLPATKKLNRKKPLTEEEPKEELLISPKSKTRQRPDSRPPENPVSPFDVMNSAVNGSLGKARIVRSGRKGYSRGKNKRYVAKSEGKRRSCQSYASKYAVSQPKTVDPVPDSDEVPYRSRPRTKNVSYHSMKCDKYETATFPSYLVVDQDHYEPPRKKSKKKKIKPIDSPPEPVPEIEFYMNGHDKSRGEPDSSIVDDLEFDIKMEPESDTENQYGCQMCDELFPSNSDLLRHIQSHI